MPTWNLSDMHHHILLCNGSNCTGAGAEEVTRAVRAEIKARGLNHQIHTTRTRCNGRCEDKCVSIVYPDGIWYKNLTPEDAAPLIDSIVNQEENLADKISHQFNGVHFKRTEGTIVGKEKRSKNLTK